MLVKFRPSALSRELVHVVLRASTSTSPDCSAVIRSLAVSGTNFTLVGSSKIAAAIARQKSTSKPVQLPCGSGWPNPASPGLEPQFSTPRDFTVLRVWAVAVDAARPSATAQAAAARTCFMIQAAPDFLAVFEAMFGRCGPAGWTLRPAARAKLVEVASWPEVPTAPVIPGRAHLSPIEPRGQGLAFAVAAPRLRSRSGVLVG